MILSVNNNSPYKNAAGEVRCASNQLGTIFDLVKEYPNKRYNIIVTKEESLKTLMQQVDYIKAVANDYTIECSDLFTLKELLKQGYNSYLKYPVTDWETFQGLLHLGVSDIYIDGPLGFQTKAIAKGKKNVKIRVTPTNSPNASLMAPSASHFFIRPEDVSLYESAIDILDLRSQDIEVENSLFSIYSRGTFNFNISELIKNVPTEVNNIALADFAKKRLDCGQRCKVPGNHCKWCDTQFLFVHKATKYGRIRLN